MRQVSVARCVNRASGLFGRQRLEGRRGRVHVIQVRKAVRCLSRIHPLGNRLSICESLVTFGSRTW
jgi:hypothetical protein